MQKEKYIKPFSEIVSIDGGDVITTSGDDNPTPGGDQSIVEED